MMRHIWHASESAITIERELVPPQFNTPANTVGE